MTKKKNSAQQINREDNMTNQEITDTQLAEVATESDVDTAESKLQAARKKAVLVRAPEDRAKVVTEKFSGFRLSLSTDPVGKKKGCNGLTITVPTDRTDTVLRLTLREATAIKAFLNRTIVD